MFFFHFNCLKMNLMIQSAAADRKGPRRCRMSRWSMFGRWFSSCWNILFVFAARNITTTAPLLHTTQKKNYKNSKKEWEQTKMATNRGSQTSPWNPKRERGNTSKNDGLFIHYLAGETTPGNNNTRPHIRSKTQLWVLKEEKQNKRHAMYYDADAAVSTIRNSSSRFGSFILQFPHPLNKINFFF